MPIEIKYSLNLERGRLKGTMARYGWHKRMSYKPRFPKGIDPDKDGLEKVLAVLEQEYEETAYKEAECSIRKGFEKAERKFFLQLEKSLGKKVRTAYRIVLTKYGVGGSYRLPDKIILNANSEFPIKTIMHEIVHLAIEPYIEKYGIGQNEKERVVDLIMAANAFAPDGYEMQERGKECGKTIDPLFKEYFKPPIRNFFEKLSERI